MSRFSALDRFSREQIQAVKENIAAKDSLPDAKSLEKPNLLKSKKFWLIIAGAIAAIIILVIIYKKI